MKRETIERIKIILRDYKSGEISSDQAVLFISNLYEGKV